MFTCLFRRQGIAKTDQTVCHIPFQGYLSVQGTRDDRFDLGHIEWVFGQFQHQFPLGILKALSESADAVSKGKFGSRTAMELARPAVFITPLALWGVMMTRMETAQIDKAAQHGQVESR